MSRRSLHRLPTRFYRFGWTVPAVCMFMGMLNLLAMAQPRSIPAEEKIRVDRKINCSTVDGEQTMHWWRGKIYSRVPGERDRHLFNLQGISLRACQTLRDQRRGLGYHWVGREMLLFFDPQGNQLLRTWKNPWTGEEVDVMQIALDPVKKDPVFADSLRDLVQIDGKILKGEIADRSLVENPLAGEHQDAIGGRQHTLETWGYAHLQGDFLAPAMSAATDQVFGWFKISKWIPWMKMGDRAGVLVFHAAGMRLHRFDELPEEIKTEIRAKWPAFESAPSLKDDRPGMTIEKQFKQWMESRNKNPQ